MPLLASKIKCPLCGAKQSADNVRCETCTRPLRDEGSASETLYTEALWSQAIDDKRRVERRLNPYMLVAVAVVALVIANWFQFRVGPDWAHSTAPWVQGSDWKTYRGVPGARIDLPGDPQITLVPAATGGLTAATVWLDSEWKATRDRNTRAVGALAAARTSLHAIVVVGGGAAPTDPRSAAPEAVGALIGGTLTNPVTTERQDPTVGKQFDVIAGFEGIPDRAGTGTIRARIIVTTDPAGATVWHLAVTASLGGDDTTLHQELVKDLVPDQVGA